MFSPVKQTLAILGFLSCALLTACTGVTPTPPFQIPASSVPELGTPGNLLTKLPQLPTFTSTVQPSLTPSATPRPTNRPTILPPTATLPIDPQATMTMQARDAYTTQIASFPFTCDEDRRTLLSPNGTWLAIHCGSSPPGQTLEVVRQDGTRWILQYSDYVHPDYLDGLGGLYPVQWTADEKYLFFSSHIGASTGGACCYGLGDHGLFRLNLATGAVSVVLPITASSDGYLYAFSPGGRRLAYVANPPVILDIKTGELTTFQVGEVSIGDLTWSPDGLELAYAACRPAADRVAVERSMMNIYSIETGLSRTILDLEKTFIRIASWDGNRQLEIELFDWQTFDTSYLYYDWASGALITPTPTPTPN